MGIRMEVIKWLDKEGDDLFHRVPEEGPADIKFGAQLIVHEGQSAVFVRDGKALDTFGPGRHTLSTKNIPLLSKLLLVVYDDHPFQASVYFVSHQTFNDLRWGTKQPILFRDAQFPRGVELRAFGKFAMKIKDAQSFIGSYVGTMGNVSIKAVEQSLKDRIVMKLNDTLGEMGNLDIADLARSYEEISAETTNRVQADFDRMGLQLVDLVIGAITPPEEIIQAIRERGRLDVLGVNYMQHKMGDVMQTAAGNEGGAGAMMGNMMGVGMGFGMGAQMPGMMQPMFNQMQQPMQQPPPGYPPQAGGYPQQPGQPGYPPPQAGHPQQPAPPPPAPPAESASANSGVDCPQCSVPVPPGGKFCANCGTKVQLPEPTCPGCGIKAIAGSKFCPECGSRLAPTA